MQKEDFLNFLNEFCFIKTEKYYLITNDTFKKIKFENKLNFFIEEIKPFYKKSKLHYLTREQTYTTFLTLIRQTCKQLNIMYSSDIKYNKSQYSISYFIFY
jgi:hypothetical protein